ncbi:nuclear transport factor 2 family protein [Streptomyces sp. NPDC002454]|uniref:nuclear transport factor 2 family protein n=1 Tax=Streptomyces sp. NPDC002490 TaxID=3154416 RepID=UPI00331BA939
MTTENTVNQIRALEEERYAAMTAGDVVALDRLFSADLVYTHSDASRDTKDSYLRKVTEGFFRYGPVSHPEHRIVVHGDCAFVAGDMRCEVRVDGVPRVLNNSALAVWGREGDSWVLLAYQPTPHS